MSHFEVRVPDLGDFDAVDVVEVHVAAGDEIEAEDPLMTLETDKATMDVPAPQAGRVIDVMVEVGSKIAAGDVILTLEPRAPAAEATAPETERPAEVARPGAEAPDERARQAPRAAAATGRGRTAASRAAEEPAVPRFGKRLTVLGAGPGGYTAAFRAADLGLEVTLIERWPTLGGVCLNVGCIPSKALLHAARVIEEVREMRAHGLDFGAPVIDTAKLVGWKNRVVGQLTQGLAALAKQRNVRIVTGVGKFVSANRIDVRGEHETTVDFDQCIIAAGSEPSVLPGLPSDPRIIDSTGALELDSLPKQLLVVGGGIIGLEMATVYEALGVRVSIVELTPTLIPGCDRDLVRPLEKRLRKRYEATMLGTRVTGVEASETGISVSFEGDDAPAEARLYDAVLVAVGRRPNGNLIGAEEAGVDVDERGFIGVDKQMRTNVPHIYAIGDIVGHPMLAHKASHEGRVAAEVAAGEKRFFDARAVPSVAYTDPEIAWVGMTEDRAKANGVAYDKATFPWAASGRALSLGRAEGLTKIIVDQKTRQVRGVGIVGTNAGDLISEACLAIEMGCDAEDIGLTIHPHPTLSETLAFAAEAVEGTITDLYMPRR